MRKSVFLHDLEKKYKDIDASELHDKAEAAEKIYNDAATSASFAQAFLYLLLGNTAFFFTSYLAMKDDIYYQFDTDNMLILFLVALVFEAIVWFIKGYILHYLWNFLSSNDWKDILVFLQADAASCLVYVPALCIYFICSFSANLSGMTFGASIIIRQIVLYGLYKVNLPQSRFIDKVILMFANMGIYIGILAILYLCVSGGGRN